jgi:hypothetical protein
MTIEQGVGKVKGHVAKQVIRKIRRWGRPVPHRHDIHFVTDLLAVLLENLSVIILVRHFSGELVRR